MQFFSVDCLGEDVVRKILAFGRDRFVDPVSLVCRDFSRLHDSESFEVPVVKTGSSMSGEFLSMVPTTKPVRYRFVGTAVFKVVGCKAYMLRLSGTTFLEIKEGKRFRAHTGDPVKARLTWRMAGRRKKPVASLWSSLYSPSQLYAIRCSHRYDRKTVDVPHVSGPRIVVPVEAARAGKV